jgi:hypothetical protein
MTDAVESNNIVRAGKLRWHKLGELYPSPVAQRHKLNQARVDHLCASLNLEQLGHPTVNVREKRTYIIDGWHRVEALRQFGFQVGDGIECWTYLDLTEQEEAARFLMLNDTLSVDALSKFTVALTARLPEETEINRVLTDLDMQVSKDKIEGAIGAVGTLRRVYRRSGPDALSRSLLIIREAYGTPGLQASVIEGISLVCSRYNGDLDDQRFIEKLGKTMGGVNGLLGKAQAQRKITHQPNGRCVAAAAVEILNSGRTGRKLKSFWADDDSTYSGDRN